MEPISQALLLFADNMEQVMSEVMTYEQLREAMLTGFAAYENNQDVTFTRSLEPALPEAVFIYHSASAGARIPHQRPEPPA